MSLSPAPAKRGRITAGSSLFGLNVALVVLLLAVVGGIIWFERDQAFMQAERNVRNMADVLAAQTREQFRTIDKSLLAIMQRLPPDAEIGDEERIPANYALLRDALRTAPVSVLYYFMVAPDGRMLGNSLAPEPPANTNLSERPSFRLQSEDASQTSFISPVVRGTPNTLTDRWIFSVNRRITKPDGSFGGLVAALIAVDLMIDFYDGLNVGEDGVVTLIHRNGRMLARSPIDERVLGADLSNSNLFLRGVNHAPGGTAITGSLADGKRRITGYRVVDDFPLLVTVGLSLNAELAAWKRYATIAAVVTIVLALAILMLLTFMQRRIRQAAVDETRFLKAEIRRKDELELYSRRLTGLTEVSVELAGITDVPLLLDFITERARRIIAAHQAVTSLNVSKGSAAQTIHSVSLSNKYAKWRDWQAMPDGSGIYRLVVENNKPMRLTQAELEAHPAWRGFGSAKAEHPPMNGWLAVPLIDHKGENFGLIQLSDRESGNFDANDEALLVQLSRLASAAIETLNIIATLRETQAQLLTAQEMARMGSWRVEVGGQTMQVSPTMQRIVGLQGSDVIKLEDAIALIHPEDRDTYFAARKAASDTKQPQQVEFRIHRADGSIRHLLSELQFEYDDAGNPLALFAIAQDVTERKTTEEQLRQSQKMETIGHLTGGVAHDFNNLLMVVMGNLDLLLDKLQSDSESAAIVNAAIAATERGAALTRQLLAYARRQPLDPRELDVNGTVQNLSRLLRRTLGEQIEIETILGGGLWRALADGTQVENAIINLAINARDAMPTGGKLTLETANASFDQSYAGLNDEVAPGQYVMIAVTDTGTGMPPDVVARAFEPFFTTKPVGRGTGLGLSMVYGFAKQSGGHAKIYSELGHGTTVKLYLPRARGAVETDAPASAEPEKDGDGNAIILVVEDDEMVRATVERMMKELGYTPLLATSGEEALPILESDAEIDLLFTDVVLPGALTGKKLAERARQIRPGLPVLYSSGYTQNSIIHQGRLDADVDLLSKPYKKQDLALRLRNVLSKRRR